MAIGHTRYSTTGGVSRINAQPLVVRHVKGTLAIAHNGNISNAAEIKQELELSGAIFHTTNDSEVISYVITKARLTEPSIEAAIEKAMHKLEGAYSMVVMSPRKLIDFKLEFGKTTDGRIVLADEISPDTCRFWDAKTNEKLDKDRFRRDLGNVEGAYHEILRRLIGE